MGKSIYDEDMLAVLYFCKKSKKGEEVLVFNLPLTASQKKDIENIPIYHPLFFQRGFRI